MSTLIKSKRYRALKIFAIIFSVLIVLPVLLYIFAVNSEKIECDYYKYLERDAAAVNSYKGEYMSQYSWAEMTLAELEKTNKRLLR